MNGKISSNRLFNLQINYVWVREQWTNHKFKSKPDFSLLLCSFLGLFLSFQMNSTQQKPRKNNSNNTESATISKCKYNKIGEIPLSILEKQMNKFSVSNTRWIGFANIFTFKFTTHFTPISTYCPLFRYLSCS